MNIEYKEINAEMLKEISEKFDTDWIVKYTKLGSEEFGLAAFDGDVPVGYIIIAPAALRYPLEHLKDAFIQIIEVDENYQRRGIGQHLVARSEEWAKKAGFKQIRTHSNDKAANAIRMWHKLNYGLCPHVYYAEEGCMGYWVAKVL